MLQASMRSSYLSPSPPISGRDISALAVIRRPSWSGAARTGSYDGSTTAAGRQVSISAPPPTPPPSLLSRSTQLPTIECYQLTAIAHVSCSNRAMFLCIWSISLTPVTETYPVGQGR